MFKAKVNGKAFDIDTTTDGLTVNGTPLNWDIVSLGADRYHIRHNNKGYNAELVKTDADTKTATFKINGRLYAVALQDKFDLLLEKMGMTANAGTKVNNVKAPMPGLIIDLRVQEGDNVKAGDALLILEAMKMENILKAAGDGTVKKLKVKKGDNVEKNQVLIEF